MLISCPKCHSIYEIPDDLIPRTGQNFRCQACANVWHAMRQDAIGYEEELEDEPYIEAIPVPVPPHRNYPANKAAYKIPADGKSGRRTRSSQEILTDEGDGSYVPPAPKVKKKKELTLTSDTGTSFTISAAPLEEEEERSFFSDASEKRELTADVHKRLQLEKPFKGYKKTYALLILLLLAAGLGFFRRGITALFPAAEPYYNKVALSGLNNPEYLRFENIRITETAEKEQAMFKIEADIANNSFYTTRVPLISVSGTDKTFAATRPLLKGHEKTKVEILLPAKENTANNLILGFVKP